MDCNSCSRFVVVLLGLLLSAYSLVVEMNKLRNNDYQAICDISEKMSCSKVFTSKYGTGFGLVAPLLGDESVFNVPNSIYGIFFYLFTFVLGFMSKNPMAAKILFYSSLFVCLSCFYLAYILYFVLKDFCVVCVSMYFINAVLLYLNWQNMNLVGKEKLA